MPDRVSIDQNGLTELSAWLIHEDLFSDGANPCSPSSA